MAVGDRHNHVQLAKEQSERATRSAYPYPHRFETGEESQKARAYREAYWDGYFNALFQFCRCQPSLQEPWPSESLHLAGDV